MNSINSSPIAQWRNYKYNHTFQASKCLKCNRIYYPKKHLCKCNSKKFKLIQLSGKGKLLTFTEITNPPEAFINMAPYCIGIIELEEKVKIVAQITDAKINDLKINMPVQAVFRKMYEAGQKGIIHYGIKFSLQ